MDIYKVKSLKNVELVIVNASLLISSLLVCLFFSITSYLLLAFCQTKLTLLEICAFPSHSSAEGILCVVVPASTTQLWSFTSPPLGIRHAYTSSSLAEKSSSAHLLL